MKSQETSADTQMEHFEVLKKHLKSFRVKGNECFTHTTKSVPPEDQYSTPSGKYYVDSKYLPSFMIAYKNAVYSGCIPSITEKPGPFGPLRVDVDLMSPIEKGSRRLYRKKDLKIIVGIYQEQLKNIIHPDEFNEKMLWCMVLEKRAPRLEGTNVKDGFHLHFPFFICDGWLQDHYIRNIVNRKLIDANFLKSCGYSTPVDKMIDTNMWSKNWMMYGSRNYKTKKSEAYIYNRWKSVPAEERYGHIFDHEINERHILDLFENQKSERKAKYNLPSLLSVRQHDRMTLLSEDVEIRRKTFSKNRRKRKKQFLHRRPVDVICKDIKSIQEGNILDMLGDHRADEYDEWMNVGWTLFNIGGGHDCQETLDMWIEFSQRSSKFVDGECEEKWQQMTESNKTIASLLFMANQDSPELYDKWRKDNVEYLMRESLKSDVPCEWDIVVILRKLYTGRFICSNATKNEWYHYDRHRWGMMDDASELKLLMVEDIVKLFVNYKKSLSDELNLIQRDIDLSDKDSDEERDFKFDLKTKKNQIKKCSGMVSYLKRCNPIVKIAKMAKLAFHDGNFKRKLDTNPMLVGCENGVLDLDREVFRDGSPDDYITLSTGVEYRDYNDDDDEMLELNSFLEEVYTNENIRNYFIDFFASCLESGNIHKRLVFFIGPPDGGKSMTFRLLQHTFGKTDIGYFGKFPRSYFTQSTNSSKSTDAREDIMASIGRKLMGTQEINETNGMNQDTLKETCGNDTISARSNYGKQIEVDPSFTTIIQCNKCPKLGHDPAAWSRVRMVDHSTHFVKRQDRKKYPVPRTREERIRMKRFPADENLKKRIPEFAPPLLNKLFKRRISSEYKTVGLIEPVEVILSTENFQKRNDLFQQFISENIQKSSEDKNSFIRLADIYQEFNTWYRTAYPGIYNSKDGKIGREDFKIEMNERLGVIRRTEDKRGYTMMGRSPGWKGYEMICEDDPDHDDTNSEDE